MMKKLLIPLIILYFCSNLAIAGNDPAKIVHNVKEKYTYLKDLTASFTQVIRYKTSKREPTNTGSILIKQGNMFRIELDNKIIVSNGETLWTYSPVHEQVVIDRFDIDNRMLAPQKLITTFPEKCAISIKGTEKIGKRITTILEFLPKDKSSTFNIMKIWVDEKDSSMIKFEIFDVSGNLSTITIDEMKFDSGIPDTKFRFIPPKGTEIIDMFE